MSDLATVVNPECPGCMALMEKIRALRARVEELERKVEQNSHQPPSSDPPAVKEQTQRARPKSGKRRGGQKGHKCSVRPLLPVEDVQDVHELVPAQCRDCGHALVGTDPQPVRHQVTELPREEPMDALPGSPKETQRWVDLNLEPTGAIGGIGMYRWGDVLDALGAAPKAPPEAPPPRAISSWRGVARVLGLSNEMISRHRQEHGDRTVEPWFKDKEAVYEWWQKLHEPPPLRRTGK